MAVRKSLSIAMFGVLLFAPVVGIVYADHMPIRHLEPPVERHIKRSEIKRFADKIAEEYEKHTGKPWTQKEIDAYEAQTVWGMRQNGYFIDP